jgi:FtsH-binding integral membrane protein
MRAGHALVLALVLKQQGFPRSRGFHNAPARRRRYNEQVIEFLKTLTGKIVSGAVALAVIAAAISWWTMDPATRHMLLSGTGRIVAWLLAVLLIPWIAFALIGWVGRMDSNLAGGVLVSAITLLEAMVLLWLFGWSLPGAAAWTFAIVGVLFAGVYNLFACDWIAEKIA